MGGRRRKEGEEIPSELVENQPSQYTKVMEMVTEW